MRIPVLDGWRATSILLVLAAHLFALGPKQLQLNEAAGAMGMALFFTLSGFLIVNFLARGTSIRDFLFRRLGRIVPLSWAAVATLSVWTRPALLTCIRNFFFVANLPPIALMEGGGHLWSLGVEMQFYGTVALLCAVLGRKGLYLIPLFCVSVTLGRILTGQRINIVTWYRVDEILAGGTLALVHLEWFGQRARGFLGGLPVTPVAVAFVACSHPDAGALQYLRPYAAALLVGSSLADAPALLNRVLVSRPMAYVASVSYAVYIIHGMLMPTWLGTGDHTVKYLKRPVLLAVTFALAHLSTRYFEAPITRKVRAWSNSRGKFDGISSETSNATVQPS